MWNVKTRAIPVIIGATGTISKSFRKYVSDIPGNHDVKELQKTAILGTSESANVKEQQNQRRNQTQRHNKQQRQNSCNNVSSRDMVCLGNMCMATLHKGDNDAIIIIIIIIIIIRKYLQEISLLTLFFYRSSKLISSLTNVLRVGHVCLLCLLSQLFLRPRLGPRLQHYLQSINQSLKSTQIFMQCLLFFRSIRKIAKSDYWLRHVCLSVCLFLFVCSSVRPLPLDDFSLNFICMFLCPSAPTG